MTRASQRGVSMVEVMISMLLGTLLLSVVFQVYLSGRQTQQLQTALTSRQESLRFAAMRLKRDVSMAGWSGCNSRKNDYHSTLRPNTEYQYQFQESVQGYQAVGAAWLPPLEPSLQPVVEGTDVLTVRYAVDTNIYVRESMPTTSSVVLVNFDADLSKVSDDEGLIAIMTNCKASTLFQITGFNPVNGSLTRNTGFDPPVGNYTKDLGEAYTVGAQIMVTQTVSYFVRMSPDGTGPSLFRRVNDEPAEELVKGIEDLQLRYGVDADNDGVPEAYINADLVISWADVVAVRVAFLAASLDGRVTEPDNRVFAVLDRMAGPFDDRRLRGVQTLTIGIRNALP